jgi:hypothetical protein
LEECSDEEEEGVSGSEEGGAKEDTCMQVAYGTDKEATKDAKSSVLEPDQEVPNVLVRLVPHRIMHNHYASELQCIFVNGCGVECSCTVKNTWRYPCPLIYFCIMMLKYKDSFIFFYLRGMGKF